MATRKLIGTDPDQVPVNGDLGTLAFQDSESVRVTNLRVDGDLTVAGAQALSGNITLGDASGDTVTINAGTTTLTQGTANGVLYLNGSKAITSGTALTFDGTNFGTSGSIGINGAAPQTPLDVISNASGYGITLRGRSGDNASSFRFTSNNYATQYASLDSGSAYLLFGISASEQMRLTSTGLGIGTSAPTSKLDVNGVIKAATIEATSSDSIKLPATTANIDMGTVWGTHLINFRAGGTPFFSISTTGGAVCNTGGFVSGLSAVSSFGSNNNYDVSFIRNNAEQMRLTSTGLGLGTTTPGAIFEVKGGNGNNFRLNNDGSSFTEMIFQNNGVSKANLQLTGNDFNIVASQAGAIRLYTSNTQRVAIDASGNVGIGTSAPTNTLYVAGISATPSLRLGSSAAPGNYWDIGRDNAVTGDFLFLNGAAERMRIDASGNVGIGTSSPAKKLDVAGTAHFRGAVQIDGGLAGTSTDGDLTINSTGSAVYQRLKFNTNNGAGPTFVGYGNSILFSFATVYHVSPLTTSVGSWAVESDGYNPILNVVMAQNIRDYFQIEGGVAGSNLVTLKALGTDTNVSINILPKGDGNVGIGTTAPAYKLEVNGSFAATTKSFVIPHPTKPGKKLRYGSLEGPENGIYIRGKIKGNVIELPEYWTKLVDPDSITVQLTSIGKNQKLYVDNISDNKVYIKSEITETPNCFYIVHAERVDVEKLEVEID